MIRQEIIALRKELHSQAELSGREFKTAAIIRKFIAKHNPTTIIENIGGAGLAAIYEYPKKGPCIAIRCELDALPIEEENDFDYCSTEKGVSHKCGHDGHMTIVAGLIFWIKQQSFSAGKIILLFQPSEENGKGAQAVISDPKFQALHSDYIFALHNIPQVPSQTIIIMDKTFSSEVYSFIINLIGKESHAAEPMQGINPAPGLVQIINKLSTLNNHNVHDDLFAILTPVHINMGQKSYGISPAKAELHYTIRTWTTEIMNALKSNIQRLVEQSSANHDLKYQIEWLEYFPACNNDIECVNRVIKAAEKNKLHIVKRDHPFKFGEDFGWYSEKYKTAMFGLGAGTNTPALHSSSYDFPDGIIQTGIDMFACIIAELLADENSYVH